MISSVSHFSTAHPKTYFFVVRMKACSVKMGMLIRKAIFGAAAAKVRIVVVQQPCNLVPMAASVQVFDVIS